MNKSVKKIPSKFVDIFDQSKIDIKVIIRDNSELTKKIDKIESVDDLRIKIEQDIFKKLTTYKKVKLIDDPMVMILKFLNRK